MDIQKKLEEFYAHQSKLSAYYHAMGILYYDGATTAPKKTAENRAHTLAILSEEIYKMCTAPDVVELIMSLSDISDSLSPNDARSVYIAAKGIKEMQKIPMDEYVHYQELLVKADDVWHTAKETNDFELFCPVLTEIFEYQKKFAAYCAPEMHPYNYCLDNYESGLTMNDCDEFFALLRSNIVPLIHRISNAEQIDDSCLFGSFPASEQEKFSLYRMETMGIDLGICGLGTTEHPFTTSLGSHKDVRITTNYDENNFASSMFSVIHEGGHALYDMNSADEFAYTNLDGGVSMGIHESQSRFYENLLGRSLPFIKYIFPKMQEFFSPKLDAYTAEDIYRAINLVTPSLIRTEADEVTYCLHVMVRYEIEKAVMSGKLEIKDIPAKWNALYKEYLGVDVPDNTRGCLQDSHWSGGGIGYFPSYALGSAYGAHLLSKMKQDIDVEACLAEGNFAPINEWNKERIWKIGSSKKSNEVLEGALGEKFDPQYYVKYLEEKYSSIYGL